MDTTVRVCRVCKEEKDCIEGICEDCVLKSDREKQQDKDGK
jgi:predicted amidophosphoribosyltransferase